MTLHRTKPPGNQKWGGIYRYDEKEETITAAQNGDHFRVVLF